MEQTQLLEWEEDGDPPGGDTDGGTLRPVGRLHLLSSKYGPEQDFWIYPGENVVGRLPSCRICLPAPSVSKAHAVIEVPAPDGPHLLYDRGSLNRTRRQRAVLLPHVRYSLTHGDTLMFGDVGCQYFLMPPDGADPEDSLEVPPTQPRPPAALAIEETPAPSKRMGYGALLARDSEDEEDPQSVGKLLHLPGSDGSDSPADAGARSQAMFLSPSATVVPESDEEGGETPDGPCPTLRLRYDSERTPSPPENGLAELPRATGVAGTDPAPALASCHLVRGPSRTGITSAPGRGPADPPEGRAVGGLGNGCPVRAGSDPAVQEAVQHPEVDPKSRSPAIEVGSDTDVEEEAAGSPDVAQHRHQHGLPGGGDAEEVAAAENPDVPLRGQQLAGNGDSDTDVEAAPEHPDVLQGRKRQPAAPEDSDTDVEEAGGNPDVVGSRSHQPSVEVGSDTDVEEAGGNPDVGPKNHQPSVEVGSDTDVEEAGGNPDVGPKNHQPSVEVGSNTDVEEAGGNPDVVGPKNHQPSVEVGSDTDVEEAGGNPDVVSSRSHQPSVEVGSDTDVEEAGGNPDVVGPKNHQPSVEVGSDTDVEEAGGNPDVVSSRSHQPSVEVGSDTDVEEAGGNPDVVGPKNHQPSFEVGSDTDVEEAGGNPDVVAAEGHPLALDEGSNTDVEEAGDPGVAANASVPAVDVGSNTDVEEEAAKNPDVVARNPDFVTKSHRHALPGSRDTDVAGPVGKPDVRPTDHRPAENDGSDTDVEEAAGSPAVAQKSHQPSAEVGGDTDVEEAEGKPDVGRQREPAVAGDSDTDVEENLDVGQQTLRRAAADSDTDVEEASGVELGRAPGPMGMPQRHGEEQPAPQSRVSPEAKVVDTEDTEEPTWGPGEESETDVEDDADFALQATQCYLPEEAPCPGAEPTRAPAPADSGGSPEEEATQRFVFRSPAQGSVMSPPAGPALLAPVCTSSEKEENSEEEPCAVEATQAFCQDPGRPSEQPPQPLTPEEEETQLLLPQASPGGALSPERARPAVPSPASVGLLPLGAQAPPPAPGPEEGTEAPGRALPAGGARKEALEEETQPVRLVLSAPRRPALVPQGEGTRAGAKPRGGSSGQRARSRRGPGGPKAAEQGEAAAAAGVTEAAEQGEAAAAAGVTEAAEQGEAAAAAGVTEAEAQPLGAQPEGAGKQVPEARPSPPLPVRRRSLRSTPVPTPTPERRSRRGGADRGRPREEEPVGPAEPSPAAPQRKGRRQLCSPAVYMDAPEPGSVGAKEVEPPVPVKRPRRGPGTQDPPREPEALSRGALGRARRSRGAAGTEPGRADEPSGGSEGVEPAASQGRARRSQRAPAREPAAGRRGAPERGGKGREMPTPDPPQAQGRRRAGGARAPEDAGSGISKKEAPAPPLCHQSTENTVEGPRARPSRRSQGASGGVASPRVLFTGVIDEAGERVVAALGGALAQSVFDCTHLVTDRVRRTVKFLCALARGVPIVTLDWLDKSGRSACFLSPSSFLVRDAEQEQNFHFSLAQSLQRARRGPLLQGYEIHVTPNVKPEPEHMKDIIQCSGGAFLPHMPRAYKDKRLVISCPEDLPRCRPALSARLPVASAEFLLTGILQQAVDLVSYRLDGPPAPPPPSAPAPSTRGSKRKGASGPAPTAPSTAKRRR